MPYSSYCFCEPLTWIRSESLQTKACGANDSCWKYLGDERLCSAIQNNQNHIWKFVQGN